MIATETYQGKAPKRYEGPDRECFRGAKCATKAQCGEVGKVNSYATAHEYARRPPISILLCESCERERRAKGFDALQLIRSDQGKAPKKVAKGGYCGINVEGVRLKNLRRVRNREGYSQRVLAAKVGISHQHIYSMERQTSGASEEVAAKLAGVLRVEISELRGLE